MTSLSLLAGRTVTVGMLPLFAIISHFDLVYQCRPIVPLGSLCIYLCTILHYLNGGHASKFLNEVNYQFDNFYFFVYFIGRSRLEPTAIVVLSVVMSLASFQLIIASIQKIVDFTSKSGTIPTVELPVILIAASTVGKYILDTSRGPQTSAELYKIIFFSAQRSGYPLFLPM